MELRYINVSGHAQLILTTYGVLVWL